MHAADRLRAAWASDGPCTPPRFESEFSDEVIAAWRAQGFLDDRTPEDFFDLDRCENAPVEWSRIPAEKAPVASDAELEAFRRVYDPASPGRFPEDWPSRVAAWRNRDFSLTIEPWSEGFFQVLGIADGVTLNRVLVALCERPGLAKAAMDHYAAHVEALLDQVLRHITVDLAFLYEPIASNHAPVISPQTYAHFAQPALRRVAACLERHGVAVRVMWTAGAVHDLIPLWLDAGVNGVYVNQAGQAGLSYAALRREFGPELRLFGGIDWRAVVAGPQSIDAFLARETRPLLKSGRYVPYLDDTVRVYMPFDHFQYYRRQLERLITDVCGE